jgi:tetratricopeptide (TPR) repeat protein
MSELAIGLLARDPRAAIDAAGAALGWVPEYPDALAVKAMGHVALEEAEPLPALAEALTRRLPDSGWGPLAQAAYHVLQNEDAAAGPWLTRAERDPDPEVQTRAAAVWFAAGRPAEASRVFSGLLARDPRNATAEVGLAMAAAARRDFRAAEEALLRALKIDPGRPAAYLQLANIYSRTARRAEALRAAQAAVAAGAAQAQADAALQGRLAD